MKLPLSPKPNSPHPLLDTVQEEIERLIDRLRFNPALHDVSLRLGASGQLVPAIDMTENESAVAIIAEMPGVARDDISITLEGDHLVLEGHKRDDRSDDQALYHLAERRHGPFRRVIPLGFIPGDDPVDAVFENGVLCLTVPKTGGTQAAPRKVQITSPA
ncbi:Hsp20/alpha crystallin family protein [Yoonia sp.]|uniref:Hsp20/alpha crystallin family protein n=1 Tax=Yoonia sp. TaxID=2212373 RepID=UPI0019E2FA29|nr:Hsp20/alpha crystallin family protein [Yoonia sp.]MBE0414003.1 Hsp20/alpha crystallin family protein [Yoonia sp.]